MDFSYKEEYLYKIFSFFRMEITINSSVQLSNANGFLSFAFKNSSKVIIMYQRIEKLSESPCSKCGSKKKCDKKLKKNDNFLDIKNQVFSDKNFNYKECGLWIALNAPEMVEIFD